MPERIPTIIKDDSSRNPSSCSVSFRPFERDCRSIHECAATPRKTTPLLSNRSSVFGSDKLTNCSSTYLQSKETSLCEGGNTLIAIKIVSYVTLRKILNTPKRLRSLIDVTNNEHLQAMWLAGNAPHGSTQNRATPTFNQLSLLAHFEFMLKFDRDKA